MLDLEQLDKPHSRWIRLTQALEGVEIELLYAGPEEQERFRQKLIRAGVLRQDKNGNVNINSHRESEFFRLYALKYITGWRGDIKLGNEENPAYDSAKMGAVLGAYGSAFAQIAAELEDETDFFSQNGGG